MDYNEMTTEEAADYLNLSSGTLENWRIKGRGPAYYKPASKVFYVRADLDAWKQAGRVDRAQS